MLKKWKSWFKNPKVPFEQRRVLIFGLGRSGSTVLEDLLQSTGYFKAHGELFHPSEPIQEDPLEYFMDRANQCRDMHFISHMKLYEMESVDRAGIAKRDFLEALIENGWKIIYLTRKNKLKHNLSSYRAQETSIFHTDKIIPTESMPVNCFIFTHGINQLLKWEKEERELLENLPFLEIQYERHLENGLSHQSTVECILEYLNLPIRSAQTWHKKVIQGGIKSVISNYEELEEVMINSGYEKYLD